MIQQMLMRPSFSRELQAFWEPAPKKVAGDHSMTVSYAVADD
jgi:hypothetical protein